MIAVIDANIALALMLDLAYSAKARQAVNAVTSMIAPDLIIHESTNALWKIATADPALAPRCDQVISALPSLFDEIAYGGSIAPEALKLALDTKHPAYDCFYIALAKLRGTALITADRKLAAAITSSGQDIQTILVET